VLVASGDRDAFELLPRRRRSSIRSVVAAWSGIGPPEVRARIGDVAVGKQLHVRRAPRAAEYLNIDPEGFSQAGYANH
jgi:hypothetical protein